MHIIWANVYSFNYDSHSLSQSHLFPLKHAYTELITTVSTEMYSEPVTTISTESRIVWTNCNYFKWNAHSMSQLQLFQLKRIIWANWNYFSWNTYGLSQLQLFQLICEWFEPITTISMEMHIVWANSNNFNWNTHSLSQLQLFQLKCV